MTSDATGLSTGLEASAGTTTAAGNDPRTELSSLTARATGEYGHKHYSAAAEFYSQAVELQASLNGEMAVENADLLYAYGRCLFKAAVEKSDVLGEKVGEATKTEAAGAGKKRKADGGDSVDSSRKKVKTEEEGSLEQGSLQFEGDDEDWSDEDDEEEDAAAGDGEAQADQDEDDDFAIAYEVLEVARVLLGKKLQEATADDSAEDGAGTQARDVKEKLADIHDLQAEIHLENEQFAEAVDDERSSLKLKEELHPFESNLIAEAHFKLSLALEFASKTQGLAEGERTAAATSGDAKVDEKMLSKAAVHMEEAIKSTKRRIEQEEAMMIEGDSEKQERIAESKSLVEEMEERLKDLRATPESLSAAPGPKDLAELIGSIMGAAGGEQSGDLKTKLEEAAKGANDLSSLVKKKPKNPEANGSKK